MKKPLVSVCIPTYNGAKYFRECLDSVLAQTFTDFELVIVDDQSADATLSIAQEYAKHDHRIRVIQNERNLGLVGNWNKCVELAQGEWIKFVFQDDLIEPSCLERLLAASKPDSLIIFCRRNFIFEAGTSETTQKYYLEHVSAKGVFYNVTEISAINYCEATLAHLGNNIVGEPTVVLLHRSAFERFGIFNPHLIMLCDLEFWTRVAVNTGIIFVPETLATFRVHSGSSTSKSHASRKYRLDVLDKLVMLHDFALNPYYAPLRNAVACQQPPIDFISLFARRAKKAWLIANLAAINPMNPNFSLLKEWNDIISLYPSILSVSKRSFLEVAFTYFSQKWSVYMHRIRLSLKFENQNIK
jgi:glycosyltransferase involved in cell wall biosynthesis